MSRMKRSAVLPYGHRHCRQREHGKYRHYAQQTCRGAVAIGLGHVQNQADYEERDGGGVAESSLLVWQGLTCAASSSVSRKGLKHSCIASIVVVTTR